MAVSVQLRPRYTRRQRRLIMQKNKNKKSSLSTKPKSLSSAVRDKNTTSRIQPVFLSKYLSFLLRSENQWKGKQSETANGQMKCGTKAHLECGWSSFCSRCVWQRKVVLGWSSNRLADTDWGILEPEHQRTTVASAWIQEHLSQARRTFGC